MSIARVNTVQPDVLRGTVITIEADIVKIIIGKSDSSNDFQISNAGKLSKVLQFNKNKSTATNTVDSFINLLKSGYVFEQITEVLIEGGFSQDQITKVFFGGFNTIVKELVKAGKSCWEIVGLLINQDNKGDYISSLAEQLRRNDFSVNPQTNKKIIVPSHRQVRMRFSDDFKKKFE